MIRGMSTTCFTSRGSGASRYAAQGTAMRQRHQSVFWLFLLLPLTVLGACGPSAADVARRKAMVVDSERYAGVQGAIEQTIRETKPHCLESVVELKTLLTQDTSLSWEHGGLTEPSGSFANAVRDASARHDSTKSCAPIVDSVARAERARTAGNHP